MKFRIYRDCDALRIRKVVIVLLSDEEQIVDKRRMFAGPLFERRLKRKMKRMVRLARVMNLLSGKVA